MGSWASYGLVSFLVVTVLLVIVTRSILPLVFIVIPVIVVGSLLFLIRRMRPEQPSDPLPVGPLEEPTTLEGRVDRMTMEDIEVPTSPGTPWEGRRMAAVYVIVISGLRYTLDPAPVRRGGYDWLQEGMWVRATFDRRTRVVYDIGPAMDPMER